MTPQQDPVQGLIERRFDQIMIRERIKWESARRSQGQRWRHLTEKLLKRTK